MLWTRLSMILLYPDWTLGNSSSYLQAQIVQNAPVRLLTGTKKRDQIAQVLLGSNCWLLFFGRNFRIQFQLIVDGPWWSFVLQFGQCKLFKCTLKITIT